MLLTVTVSRAPALCQQRTRYLLSSRSFHKPGAMMPSFMTVGLCSLIGPRIQAHVSVPILHPLLWPMKPPNAVSMPPSWQGVRSVSHQPDQILTDITCPLLCNLIRNNAFPHHFCPPSPASTALSPLAAACHSPSSPVGSGRSSWDRCSLISMSLLRLCLHHSVLPPFWRAVLSGL